MLKFGIVVGGLAALKLLLVLSPRVEPIMNILAFLIMVASVCGMGVAAAIGASFPMWLVVSYFGALVWLVIVPLFSPRPEVSPIFPWD